jgi:hypothetical protein
MPTQAQFINYSSYYVAWVLFKSEHGLAGLLDYAKDEKAGQGQGIGQVR